MSLIFISEYNQTYHTHPSCYYCLGLTLCYNKRGKAAVNVACCLAGVFNNCSGGLCS